MTGFAAVITQDVIDGLTGGGAAVMATHAIVHDTVVRERSAKPGGGDVATITFQNSRDMGGTLAGGNHTVMTTAAAANHRPMVNKRGIPHQGAMSGLAAIVAENMIDRLAGRG